jgi:hypothetical protein
MFAGGITAGVAAILVGCLSIERMAPPVTAEFEGIGMQTGVTMSVLERGREIYLADCSRCHSVEPIDRYSTDRWHDIISRMKLEAKLDDRRTAALQAYVLAAHEVLAHRATTN